MSCSEDDSVIETPYSSRADWSDVTPVAQNDGPFHIVRIAYTDAFVDVYSYFRAVVQTNELSERAFELTKDAALLNPANYTVWYYRRVLIRALNKNLSEELGFISQVISDNPKNYQVWQHRKCIVDMLSDACDELHFTQSILNKDSKNYHAWQYRQYVIKQFKLWNDELEFINSLIDADVKNNSAWNQRYFYFNNTADLATNNEVVQRELEYCKQKIYALVDNESVWNYVRGLFKQNTTYLDDFAQFCIQLNSTLKDDERSPLLLAFIVYFYEEKLNDALAKDTESEAAARKQTLSKDQLKEHFNNAIQLVDGLSTKYDLIRKNYWNFIRAKWNKNYQKLITN